VSSLFPLDSGIFASADTSSSAGCDNDTRLPSSPRRLERRLRPSTRRLPPTLTTTKLECSETSTTVSRTDSRSLPSKVLSVESPSSGWPTSSRRSTLQLRRIETSVSPHSFSCFSFFASPSSLTLFLVFSVRSKLAQATGSLISAVKDACRAGLLDWSPRIMLAMYTSDIQTSSESSSLSLSPLSVFFSDCRSRLSCSRGSRKGLRSRLSKEWKNRVGGDQGRNLLLHHSSSSACHREFRFR